MVRRLFVGVVLALLLSVLAFVGYPALPSADCSRSTPYIHAVLRRTAGKAAAITSTALGSAHQRLQANGSSTTTEGVLQGLLDGLLRPNETTPAFLDAAVAAGVSSSELRQLVQIQQDSFCRAGYHQAVLPGSTTVAFGNVTIFVYGSGDIVSNNLKGAAHGWENTEIQEWLWAIRQYWRRPGVAAAAAAGVVLRPLAVDIGANLAWFSLNAAAAGARVAAFEAMPHNLALIRRSLCASPWLAQRIALYDTGLGDAEGTCYIVSGVGNRGDGMVSCDKDKAHNTTGYEVRGAIPVRLLDTLLQEEVQVLKIDVEGYEQKVLTGARQLLTRHKVHYIMAECNTGIIGEAAGKAFIQFLHAHGYEVSPMSFRGPYWDTIQIPKASCSNINLYARRRAD